MGRVQLHGELVRLRVAEIGNHDFQLREAVADGQPLCFRPINSCTTATAFSGSLGQFAVCLNHSRSSGVL